MVTSYYKNPHPVAYRDEILAPVPGWGMTPNLAGQRIIGIGDSDIASTAGKAAIGFGIGVLAAGALLVGISALSVYTLLLPTKIISPEVLAGSVTEAKKNGSRRFGRRARANGPEVAAVAEVAARYAPVIIEGTKAAYQKAKPQLERLYAKYGPEFTEALEKYVVAKLRKVKDEKVAEVAEKRLTEVAETVPAAAPAVASANRRYRSNRRR